MMISPVSFKSSQPASSFQDKINKPQAFQAQTTPQGASGLEGKTKKKGSIPKTIAKVLVAAAAVAGALVLTAKTGILKYNPEGNGAVNAVKDGINFAGDFIADNLVALKDKFFPKVVEEVENAAGTIA